VTSFHHDDVIKDDEDLFLFEIGKILTLTVYRSWSNKNVKNSISPKLCHFLLDELY